MTVAPLQSSAPISDRKTRLLQAEATVNHIILGKNQQVKLAFSCLLAGGHLLSEDFPGVGKTTLAHALAIVIGSRYQHIQFTNDLLPADIMGVSIYRREEHRFEFHTAAVVPERVEREAVNSLTERRYFLDFAWLRSTQNTFDLLQRGWNQWVIAFDASRQSKNVQSTRMRFVGCGQTGRYTIAIPLLAAMSWL